MPGNRLKSTEFILKYISKLAPNSGNLEIYKKMFEGMNDKQYDSFMRDLKSGEKFLIFISPNFANSKLTVDNNLKIGDELGHNFFQKLWIEGSGEVPTYLTPIEYLVVDLPVRKASQLLIKKIKVPDSNKVIDTLTGQPTGESKGAKISYPELQVCSAMGLDNSMVELMKYRGGDNKGLVAFNGMLSKYGTVNLSTISQYSSGVESTNTLKTLLNCMHLRSTL